MKVPTFYLRRLPQPSTARASGISIGSVQAMVAIVSGIVAAILALSQWHSANEQRLREFRFQQARQGRELLSAFFDDQTAIPVRAIFDHEKYVRDGITITRDDLINILENGRSSHEASDIALASLDAVFYHLALIDHWIETGLVQESDVLPPLKYYARVIIFYDERPKKPFTTYAKENGFEGVVGFLRRYSH